MPASNNLCYSLAQHSLISENVLVCQERFRSEFGNGVGIVIGCMSELMKHPVDRIVEHVSAELRRVA